MTRNEFIDGGIRILGVYFLTHAIIMFPQTLPVIFAFLGVLSDLLHAGGFHVIGSYFNMTLNTLIPVLMYLILGWYLLNGGKWFYERATREHS